MTEIEQARDTADWCAAQALAAFAEGDEETGVSYTREAAAAAKAVGDWSTLPALQEALDRAAPGMLAGESD